LTDANFGKITQMVGAATATTVGTAGGLLGGSRLINFLCGCSSEKYQQSCRQASESYKINSP
jgi:hypothetical protein